MAIRPIMIHQPGAVKSGVHAAAPLPAVRYSRRQMVTLDIIVMMAYMVGILAAGIWAKSKVTSQDQFLVAGREHLARSAVGKIHHA